VLILLNKKNRILKFIIGSGKFKIWISLLNSLADSSL